jgi:hypothetical protein
VGDESIFKTAALREVNQHILGVARESISEELEWEFFCECGDSDCHEYVSLTLEDYVAIHDGGREVLAPGHQLSQVARARLLAADAEALCRQAQHQLKRAQRNLRSRGG